MKRIIVAAVAAASLASAAPASAQDLGDIVAIKQPGAQCITPVTKCVDEAADRAVALVMYYYDAAGNLIQDPPPIDTVCKLIWEEGCGTDAIPF